MRGLLVIRPREAAILAFGMIAMLFIFLARIPQTLAAAPSRDWSPEAMVSAQFVTLILFAPLFLYGIAALMQTAFHLTGGKGGWYETRLAFFWTVMVTAPAHGLALMIPHPLPGLLAAGAAVWILSGCLAEAQGVAQWRAGLVAVGSVGLLLGLTAMIVSGS